MSTQTDVDRIRKPDYDSDPIFHRRWSPRAMSGEKLSEAEINTLFEAARWSPSCFNEQPWRFLYARAGSYSWNRFFDLMVEGNQGWAKNAALLVVVSRETFERNNSPSPTHSYDTGAAWQSLALQGSRMGLVVHGMAGFDYDAARVSSKVPPGFQVEAMIAVGRPGRLEDLEEKMREREVPSERKPVAAFAFEGSFPNPD